jgi:hypothetical protein
MYLVTWAWMDSVNRHLCSYSAILWTQTENLSTIQTIKQQKYITAEADLCASGCRPPLFIQNCMNRRWNLMEYWLIFHYWPPLNSDKWCFNRKKHCQRYKHKVVVASWQQFGWYWQNLQEGRVSVWYPVCMIWSFHTIQHFV